MDNRSLRAQVRGRFKQYQVDLRTTGVPMIVGDCTTPNPNVWVVSRPGYIWVRNTDHFPIQVFCKKINPGYNMNVMVGYDPMEPQLLQVLSVISGSADGYYAPPGTSGTGNGSVSPHAATHLFTASDPVFIYDRQMLDGRIESGTIDGSSATLNVREDIVFINGVWTQISERSIDLTSYIPASGSVVYSRYVGLTVSNADVVTITLGNIVVGMNPLLTDIPTVPESEYLLGFVRLHSGMTFIADGSTYTDILDPRTMLIPGGGVAPASVTYLTSGSTAALPNHRQLIAGTGVIFTDSGPGGSLTINATGAGGGNGGSVGGEFLRRDASNEPVTGHLDINTTGSSAFRVQSATYTLGSVLSSGSIPVTSDDGATITGLSIGQWYAVESSGGPWAPWAGITPCFYTFSASNVSSGSSGWQGIMGFQDAIPGDPLRRALYPTTYYDYPTWASYYEAVGNYGRFYFNATTTSIRVRVADYLSCSDNSGTLIWTLYAATGNVSTVLNVDTVSNMVTVTGDLTVTAPKNANYVLAGPVSGSAATATFRQLVAGDISGLSTGGHTIQDEGVSLPTRAKLNFVGSGVTAADDVANDASKVMIPHYEILQDSDGAILTDSTGAIIYVGVM